jgi:hypothetical protein
MHRSLLGFSALSILLAMPAPGRAEQVVVVDVTYTHAADTTSDSHYRVPPRDGSPSDWTSPIDYTKGSAHVLLEVKTKPSATPTKFQICFQGTPAYACTYQAPEYTAVGKYEWDTPWDAFWYGGEVDWSQGVDEIALILKDTSNGKPQGDPNYVPTDLRVQVTLVSQGSTFVQEVGGAAGSAAGSGGASGGGGAGAPAGGSGGRAATGGAGASSVPQAGRASAGTGGAAPSGGSRAAPEAGKAAGSAGASPQPSAAGAPAAGALAAAGTGAAPAESGGCDCNASGAAGAGNSFWLVAAWLLHARRRRRLRPER